MDAAFLASKLGWVVLAPSNLLLALSVAAFLMMRFNRTRQFGNRLATVAIVALTVVLLLPVGDVMLRPLEQRFPPLRSTCFVESDGGIAGIILIGGAMSSVSVDGRFEEDLGEGADRIHLAASLALEHPQSPLLVSGGQVFPTQGARDEATAIRDVLIQLGVPTEQMVLETASRTTSDNAAFTSQQANATNAQAPWLLVTSAFHMPRAIGAFRAAGLNVVAAPTDWQADDRFGGILSANASERLQKLDLAAKEYLGLLAYWLMGRTSELFPAPISANTCS